MSAKEWLAGVTAVLLLIGLLAVVGAVVEVSSQAERQAEPRALSDTEIGVIHYRTGGYTRVDVIETHGNCVYVVVGSASPAVAVVPKTSAGCR